MRNPLGIPRRILAAAQKAGLKYPDWYIGGRESGDSNRDLDTIAAEESTRLTTSKLCLKQPGHDQAALTFIPRCSLPRGHDGQCNWAERMELRAKLRAQARESK